MVQKHINYAYYNNATANSRFIRMVFASRYRYGRSSRVFFAQSDWLSINPAKVNMDLGSRVYLYPQFKHGTPLQNLIPILILFVKYQKYKLKTYHNGTQDQTSTDSSTTGYEEWNSYLHQCGVPSFLFLLKPKQFVIYVAT